MRLFLLPLCVLALGSIPARATTYDFDFHYNAASYGAATYAPAQIVFTADSLDATTLFYQSGDVNGYAPATLEKTFESSFSGLIPVYSQLDVGAAPAEVEGIDYELYVDTTSVGIYPAFFGFGAYRLVNNPFQPGTIADVSSDGYLAVTEAATTPTPEPGTWGLVGTGVLGLVGMGRRRLGV